MSHDNPNFQALDWLTGEINESLSQARQYLETFAADGSGADPALLHHCLDQIHQVHGSLHMAELTGAAMLAEEMEQLLHALSAGEVENSDETREFLMRALLELPLYLEKVAYQRRDNAVLLLPLLNDLRAVRRERLISEGALFSPNLSVLELVTGSRQQLLQDNARLQDLVGKLRKMYHVAAAGLIRDVNSGDSITYLLKVSEKMSLLYSGSLRQPLWQVLQGIFEAISESRIHVLPALRQLLRRIDVEFRLLQGRGAAVLDAPLDRGLVSNLLFYVYLAGPNGPRCKALYQTFALDQAVPGTPRPDTDDALAMGPEAMGTAVAALREELQSVRDALEPGSAGVEQQPLGETATVAKRLADTIGVLGLEDQRTRAREVYELLRDASRSAEPQDLLMEVAGRILELDSSLEQAVSRQSPSQPTSPLMGDATDTVVREARAGLEGVKESVVEFIASHWDVSYLIKVPDALQGVGGGLEMVGYQRAARIIGACNRYIREQLIDAAEQPDWKVLDTLADAITSVDYYLERRAEGVEDADMLLALAEDSVAALGFEVPAGERSEPRELVVEKAVVPEPPAETATEEAPAMPVEETLAAPVAEPETVKVVEAPKVETPAPAEPVAPAAVAEEESLIDDEILEIFLEEAAEVLETIGEYFPRWAADSKDDEALTEFRRGFHTLKGSGRMVEALDIGELSWAVENMLNRVIDGSVKPARPHVDLIQRVIDKLPSMIEGFRTGSGDPDPALTAQLESWGEQLARGDIPADMGAAPEPAAPVSMPDAAVEAEEDRDQLWEIFAQEAESHLAVVDGFLDDMRLAAPIYAAPSDPLHRALHTLKGSAHMADITAVAELVAPMERFAKELRTYQVHIDADIFDLIQDLVLYVRGALAQIRAGEAVAISKSEQFLARTAELQERSVGHLIREREANEPKTVDPQLLAVIMADGMKVLLDADQMLAQWRQAPTDIAMLGPVVEELAILQEAANRAQLPTLAELSGLLLQVYNKVVAGGLEAEPALWASLEQGHNELLDLVDAVAAAQDLPEVSEAVGAALQALVQDASAPDDEEDYDLAELGIDSADLPTTSGDGSEAYRLAGEDDPSSLEEVHDELQQAAMVADAGELVAPSDEYLQELSLLPDSEPVSDTDVELEAFNQLNSEEEAIVIESADKPDDFDLDLSSVFVEDAPVTPAPTVGHQEPVVDEAPVVAGAPPAPVDDAALSEILSDIDPDVVEVFMEEALDLVEELEELIQNWEQEPADVSQAEALKRVLHTFKGGARMAGLMGLGEVAHRFESVIERMPSGSAPSADFFADSHAIYDRIAAGVDTVRAWMGGEQLQAFADLLDTRWADTGATAESATTVEVAESQPEKAAGTSASAKSLSGSEEAELARELEEVLANLPTTTEPAVDMPQEVASTAVAAPAAAEQAGAGNVLPFVSRKDRLREGETQGPNRGQPQEMVRVAAELLEELVNLAGETSISRGRLEEQVSEFGFVLDEMDSTLHRLNEQLRRLDTETEAQILFRQEQLAEQDDSFDPLEMDRYSSIQQLSRSLLESTSDLLELRSNLGNKARDTETLLLQQSRVNTELQEGLMRSRMVPFSRLVPRLRRIVRQVSSELGKQVDLVFSNVEGELDRSMLERMVAPLEHMLRNAVDHGIEMPDERAAAGKAERGRISVALAREGSEVVLTISDDGAGINLLKVREKAVERGLMRPDAELSNNEILQFILHAGFSTADKVTQISGRGVGMDVVSAEIKQIGGSVDISSNLGAGTEFVIRLPFTVSVNRALMVRIGDDMYAMPLNTIEGIVRLSPFELEHYYQSKDARFEYAGEPYQVRYFGNLLGSEAQPKLSVDDSQLPVLLVRSEGTAMALQVDAVLGSREIVVKSLGPQFAAVQGVSGATVTGDGQVVVILDAHAMLRQHAALLARPETVPSLLEPVVQAAPEPEEEQLHVMVVDDSVTVRKVTTRFLEREGYQVTTAKDGQDAVIQLQDFVPDMILLDIEMPRMDGFEVARHIRASDRLRDIPIIMITSRTGQKHREHAMSLGVNHYLGKPYQEEVLLEAIRDYTEVSAEH